MNLVLSAMGAFAEFERALIRERQREGIGLAKARGVYRGRKRSLSDDEVAEVRRRIRDGAPKAVLARDSASGGRRSTSPAPPRETSVTAWGRARATPRRGCRYEPPQRESSPSGSHGTPFRGHPS